MEKRTPSSETGTQATLSHSLKMSSKKAPPDELMRRVQKRDEIEIFETLEDLEKVRNKALMLTKNWHIIDTSGTVTETQKQIANLLENIQKT